MTARGPKPQGVRRRQNQPLRDTLTVENVRFASPPALPRGPWPPETLRWWRAVSTMPVCALWEPSDWEFAFATAVIHRAFVAGQRGAAAELRHRERIMATTMDARIAQRIVYVDPEPEEERRDWAAYYRERLQ